MGSELLSLAYKQVGSLKVRAVCQGAPHSPCPLPLWVC